MYTQGFFSLVLRRWCHVQFFSVGFFGVLFPFFLLLEDVCRSDLVRLASGVIF
jgi:hypothetical protein